MRTERILIVGGGIAGLAAARVLASKGFSPTLIEKAKEWTPVGGGIYVPGNGVNALDKMGLGRLAREKGCVIDHRSILSGKGKLMMRLDLEKVWGRKKPCLGILRRDLHDILSENLGDVDVRFGTTISKLQQFEKHVDVSFSTGDVETFDLVIGADGLHSTLRDLTLGKMPVRRVGELCCRFVIERPKNLYDWTLYAGKQTQFLMVPMSDKQAYVYVGRQPKSGEILSKDSFLDPFKNFPDMVSKICKTVSENDLIWSSLNELDPLKSWGENRIVLIGDAAHAMPPFMAQGASLAFEDALVLGQVLSQETCWNNAAHLLTDARQERVHWTISRNRRREKLTNLPYWISSLGIKLVGKKTWIEDYAPLAEPLEIE